MKFTTALVLLIAAEQTKGWVPQPILGNSLRPERTSPIFGILDEIQSDSYDLMGSDDSDEQVNMSDAYEMFLADLVFSTNDPRVDIANKMDLAGDPEFMSWLDNKIENSRDPEERMALRDLYDIIVDVQTKLKVNEMVEQRKQEEEQKVEEARISEAEAQAEAGRQMSNADILRKARAIETQMSEEELEEQQKKKNFYEQELTAEIKLSYENLLKKVLPPYKPGETAASVVLNNYDQFDAQFVKVLNERAVTDEDSAALLQALAAEQQNRLATATATLQGVLQLGDPMKMEGKIVQLAREGKIDEPLMLLLEANETQARDAGAIPAADLMRRLMLRAQTEKDKQSSSKEIRLIRQLLREPDANKRETILEQAFTPKEALLVPGTAENAQKAVDGEVPEAEQAQPDVPPPDFINACKAVLLNFGNLDNEISDRGDLATQIKKIAGEAEVVATRIFGKGMTLQEQQDRMWEEQTTSIFDLERMEIEAERMGQVAPWTNSDDDSDMLMPGFDADGRMQIGGQ